MTNVELRDPYASYHKMTVAEANKLTPLIDLEEAVRFNGY